MWTAIGFALIGVVLLLCLFKKSTGEGLENVIVDTADSVEKLWKEIRQLKERIYALEQVDKKGEEK